MSMAGISTGRRMGEKPLSEPMTYCPYMRHSASINGRERDVFV